MRLFISFEGGDGSGKSSQAKALCERLLNLGHSVTLTHEPGGTPLSDMVREVLRNSTLARRVYTEWFQLQVWSGLNPRTELFLFEAARAQLVAEVILPQLEQGGIVICDRYTDSTLAYQGYARGLDLDFIRRVNDFASQGLTPDITILLDIPVEVGLTRKRGDRGLDRIEREELVFHESVRKGYLEMARGEPNRWLVVNADQPPEAISQTIWQRVSTLLKEKERH